MKFLPRTFRTKVICAIVTLLVGTSVAYATLSVSCVGCQRGYVGVATATPSGYYEYEWVVAYPGYASPAVTNTNSTFLVSRPALFGFVFVKACDSSHNLIDNGVAPCGF